MNAQFFTANRHALQKNLGSGALVVIAGYGEVQRTNDAAWPFEQEANFWYLSGIVAPDWWLIIDGAKSWAVAPSIDEIKQAFDGSLSPSEAQKISAVDHVIDRDEAMSLLRRLCKQHSLVYTTSQPEVVVKYYNFTTHPEQAEVQAILERTFQNVESCNKQLAKLRTIKQEGEVKAIQKAINHTIDGLKAVKSQLKNYKYEYQAEAAFNYEIHSQGSDGEAFTAVVASGANACTIHHMPSKKPLKRPSFILLDVGARYDGYAADVCRTYALGKSTARQRSVHEVIVGAHQDIISFIEPGLKLETYQEMVDNRMKRAFSELKLDPTKLHELMPHAIGHGLGIDVHDPIAGYDTFQPGMVLTVEPGVYLPKESIGVRIEDDILVTETGRKVLSAALPTDI